MLDLQTDIDLMKKYGYTSTSVYPYIYKTDTNVGICYSFVDDHYGILERVAIFRTSQEMDDFLKKYQWFKVNGKKNNVTMVLDDYDSPSPNIIYYRNGHMMANDEMFNLDKYDNIEVQKHELDEIDKYVLESANLMSYYNDVKDQQLEFVKKLDDKIKEQRKIYYDLQILVDKYNNSNEERVLLESAAVTDLAGINIDMERALKERLSQYKSNPPEKKEAIDFILEIWNLTKNLELNYENLENHYKEMVIDFDNEIASQKIEFMKQLVEGKKRFNPFKKDIVKQFKKIDMANSSKILEDHDTYIEKCKQDVEYKYSFYEKLDILKTGEYLKETKLNNNYAELAIKYSDFANKEEINIVLEYEEVIKLLKEQFQNISAKTQNALILYFSKYKDLFEIILDIDDYDTRDVKDVIVSLNSNKLYKDLKKKLYDNVKESLSLDINKDFVSSIFASYDFTSEETFISSCISTIKYLRECNDLILPSDADVFFITDNYDNLTKPHIVDTTTNVAKIYGAVKSGDSKSLLVTLKKGMPVLYSDRYVDLGEGNSKFAVRERNDNNICFSLVDASINKSDVPITVAKYSSKPIPDSGISIVDKLILSVKNDFYKLTINKMIISKDVVEVKSE